MKYFLAAGLVAMTAVGPATAQEAPVWSGFYAGVQGGYGFGESDVFADMEFTFDEEPGSIDYGGGLFGATLGYNRQNGLIVFGLESDVSLTGIDDGGDFDTIFAALGDDFPLNVSTNVEYEWFATARGRVGVATDRFLVFATGGLAIADVKLDGNLSGAGITLPSPAGAVDEPFSASDTRIGWTLGAGIEARITEGWSAKIEYLHTDLGSEDYDVPVFISGFGVTPGTVSVDYKLDIVRAGLNYRF